MFTSTIRDPAVLLWSLFGVKYGGWEGGGVAGVMRRGWVLKSAKCGDPIDIY